MDDVVAVVTDLFFQSRILAAAKPAQRRVHFVASEGALAEVQSFSMALVDLDARADVLGMIRALKARTSGAVVAFGPHVDTAKRKAARAAGADRVLARSKFVTELPRLMAQEERATPASGYPTGARTDFEAAGSTSQE